MRKASCPIAAVVACLVAALSGCGAPFFVSEADLRAVLGKEHLYAGTSAGIEAFDVDVETGRITRLAGSPFGAGCIGTLASTPGGTALYGMPYIASEVYRFSIDPGGTLSPLLGSGCVPTDGATTFASARSMAVSPDGRFAHMMHSGSTEALTSYSVDPDTGALTFLGSTLGLGCSPYTAAIDATGSHLYVSRAYPSAILHFPVETGLPGAQTGAATPSAAALRMAVHPSGYLYGIAAGVTDQNILAYRIDSATGALTALSGSPYRLGFGPTNISGVSLAIDRGGAWLYATSEDDQLYRYHIDGGSGALSLIQGLGTSNGARVAASNSGRYVYVAGDIGGAGCVRVYQVSSDGSLSEIAGSPFLHPSGVSYDARAVKALSPP